LSALSKTIFKQIYYVSIRDMAEQFEPATANIGSRGINEKISFAE